MGATDVSQYGAHAGGVPPAKERAAPKERKKRELPPDFKRRPVPDLVAEFDDLITEVECDIVRLRGLVDGIGAIS